MTKETEKSGVTKTEVTKEAPSKDLIHTVKRGESLWFIAEKYLGNGIKYTEIMKFNEKTSPLISVGEKIKIPKK